MLHTAQQTLAPARPGLPGRVAPVVPTAPAVPVSWIVPVGTDAPHSPDG